MIHHASIAALLVVMCAVIVVSHDLYRAARVGDKHYLLLRNRHARLINDTETFEVLDPLVLPEISEQELHKSYSVGAPLPRIAYTNKLPDDCMRVFLLKSSILNGDDLMFDYTLLGEYMNPSVLAFRGRLLMVVPLQVGFTGSEHRKPTGTIEFKWLNSSSRPFYSNSEYLGVGNEVHALNRMFVGEDRKFFFAAFV